MEALGPQKSSFIVNKLTFLRPESLQNIFLKNCHTVNFGLQIFSHCKKKKENLKNPMRRYILRFFILDFSLPSFFYETKSGIYFYQISLIIVNWFYLLCRYPNISKIKYYEIQGVYRFSVFYFTKLKTDGTPP